MRGDKGGGGCQQCHDPGLAELQAGGGLSLWRLAGQDETSEAGIAEATVMSGALQLKQPSIDVLADGTEVGEVTQTPFDADIIGVVESGLGAHSAPLLKVLLDVAALVLDVEAGQNAMGNHAGGETARGTRGNTAFEEELYAAGTAEVQIVADNLLKELAPTERTGKS